MALSMMNRAVISTSAASAQAQSFGLLPYHSKLPLPQRRCRPKPTTTKNISPASWSHDYYFGGRSCSSFSPLCWNFMRSQNHDKLKLGGVRGKSRSICNRAFPSQYSPLLTTDTSRWLYAASALVLMLSKNARIYKPFLVPLMALEAPRDLVSWFRGDYGLWTAFVLFLVRLFYYIPGDLELPFLFIVFVIIAPLQILSQRATQPSMVLTIAAAAYLSFQHYRTVGGFKGLFEKGNVICTTALTVLLCVPLLFLSQGFFF